jgi:hypothetical protein
MDTIQKARDILLEAERGLRDLMETALADQRYGDLGDLAEFADALSQLCAKRRTPAPAAFSHDPTPSEAARRGIRSTRRRASAARSARGERTRPSKNDYPRFERDGDKLVKIGWSKKKREIYEHRAPRQAVIAFARHVSNRAGVGQVFTMESLLPVPDVSSGGEVPDYQVYLTLAWLRDAGAVEKKGRNSYVLKNDSLPHGGLEKLWADLPQHGT